ncbi:zinc-dependent alcohol dehydrogenase family protein [Labrys okinawensis]|uniref:zinc-dependent alcohol dehydrogenase family protein n=1 Tax=Labrys okinawensis TaxID=346911 RepID=UPI0039BC4A31
MTKVMRRWEMTAFGRNNLFLSQVPVPAVRSGEVLVKVSAVALNNRDNNVIEAGGGLDVTFPFTPASDMAGTVVKIGENSCRFKPGDRVISTFTPGWLEGRPLGDARDPAYRSLGGFHPGVLSEFVSFPEAWFVAAPTSLDDGEASTLPCAGLTAWFALVERGQLRAGQTVVVQGTGGVALFGLQIAKAHGAEVFLTSSSPEKLERAKTLGADHGINRQAEDWVEAVWSRTGNRGADHILEVAGGSNLGKSLHAVAAGGHIAVISALEGSEVSAPILPLLLKVPRISGISVGHRRALEDLVAAVDRTRIKPVIDKRYRLEDLPAALDHLNRGAFGKLVIEIA